MNTAKLGVIFIVAAMALAGVSAGYAAWFDTITVHGTVSTGDVDINVVDYSGTWVWKVYGCGAPENEIYVWHGFVGDLPDVQAMFSGCTVELISKAYAAQAADASGVLIDDAITVIYDNLFPCIDSHASTSRLTIFSTMTAAYRPGLRSLTLCSQVLMQISLTT